MASDKRFGAAGTTLWGEITADVPAGVELDARELALLGRACRLADRIEALEAVIEQDGLVVAGSKGQPVLHPAVAESRQSVLTIQRLLGTIDLSVEPLAETPGQRRGRLAAEARWNRRKAS